MLTESNLIKALKAINIPTDADCVTFDPPNDGGRFVPSMYINDAQYRTYFYANDNNHSVLSIGLSESHSYMISVWGYARKLVVTLIDEDLEYDENTKDLSNDVIFCKNYNTEEEHFQDDCLKGVNLSWECIELINGTFKTLTAFYFFANTEKN